MSDNLKKWKPFLLNFCFVSLVFILNGSSFDS